MNRRDTIRGLAVSLLPILTPASCGCGPDTTGTAGPPPKEEESSPRDRARTPGGSSEPSPPAPPGAGSQ